MTYIICSFCKKTHIQYSSDSWIHGGCIKCRYKLVPDHIPHNQVKRFLDTLNSKDIFDDT